MHGPAIYLTGVPGVGKTSIAAEIEERTHDVEVLRYSDLLMTYMADHGDAISHRDLRQASGARITPEIVSAVDLILVERIDAARHRGSALIDSHAVTAEPYGLRVTPYGTNELVRLGLTGIVCLVADLGVIEERRAAQDVGRVEQSRSDIDRHQRAQEAVAVAYACGLGVPLYLVDASGNIEDVVQQLVPLVGIG
ncbi:MAG: ATP-binding protein [Acidimicrobiales bacterium]